MSGSTKLAERTSGSIAKDGRGNREFITMMVGEQLFGLPVLIVHDVLGAQKIARIPLAAPEVAGSLNLRGRIVTAIDLRRCLGLPSPENPDQNMSIVVDHQGELYSLIIDSVGEVLSLPGDRFERNPPTLDPRWSRVAAGIYRLDDRLLVVLNVEQVLNFRSANNG